MIQKTACKYKSVTSIDLVKQCFRVCSWIPLTMVKSLLLNSASTDASSVINKFLNFFTVCKIRFHLRIPLIFCGIHLQLRNAELLAIFACCGIRNKINEPTKFTLQVYVRRIHINLVSGIHLLFETCLNTCVWNPGTYRHKIVRLSSVMLNFLIFT